MNPIGKLRVDRKTELALLERVANCETRERIVLIHAESGMGKSELLREFKDQSLNQRPLVFIGFENEGLSLADVLVIICDRLGRTHFPTLAERIQQLAQPTVVNVNVTRNLMFGANDISIAMAIGAADEPTRSARRAALTEAFVTDLRALERITLIFDVFEKCDPSVREWVISFLPHADTSPGLSVMIAGQKTPERSDMWACAHLPLKPIEPQHWFDYAQLVEASVSLDQVKMLCYLLKGHCSSIAIQLESLRGRSV